MLFNSLIFVVFAILFFLVWKQIGTRIRARLIWLTAASFFFYGWWDWRFLFLIIFSGLVDYGAALAMERFPKQRKVLLITSILVNLGSLSLFKYSGFVAQNLDSLFGLSGSLSFSQQIPNFFLITPVGISFYTFQSMSYTIDVYRNKFKPTKSLVHFFAYLSMFPQLVAGPIVRAKEMLPQLLEFRKISKEEQWLGFTLIVRGYFKKMVIADQLAPLVVAAFSAPNINPSTTYWWGTMIAFALQIYCDFSGYSDIARGLARWMGYDFPDNFNHPYQSTSLRDFWTRWHISLSTWFKDYVYIPLGGSKKGKMRGHINMWITMVLSGLWHGAAWTYVLWGAAHALFLSIERITHWPEKFQINRITRLIGWTLVTIQILSTWVLFRAVSIEQACSILKTMFTFTGSWNFGWGLNGTIFIFGMMAREIWVASELSARIRWNNRSAAMSEMIFYALIICAIIFFRGEGSEFIYFQF